MDTLEDELRIQILGPVRAEAGGAAIQLGPPKQRAIFALLALRAGHPVLVDEMMEALWGDQPPSRAANLVHTYVARLRQKLEPHAPRRRRINVIASVPGGYRLAVPHDALDLHVFRRRQCRAADLHSRPDLAFEMLGDALRQWQDPRLDDLTSLLPHHNEIGPLRGEFVSAAIDYITLGLQQHHDDTVLPLAARLASAEPLNERVQAKLLEVLVSTGQRAWAIERYLALQARLRDELGVDPGPELTAAYQAALSADAPVRAAPAPGTVSTLGTRNSRIAHVDELIGRETDFDCVKGLLGRYRLVTLTGTAGVGKTALALSVADAVKDGFADGAAIADLAEARSLPEVVNAVSATLTGVGPSRTGDAISALAGRLGEHELLLVLDNAELVTEETSAVVEDILRGCPRVRILLTSRELLGLPYEAVYPVRPLELRSESPTAPAGAALTLFARRAAQVRHDFRLTEANVGTVATVCRSLDGLPLAIELAAASMRTGGLETLVAGLGDPLRQIRPTRRGEPNHHRTLHAAVRRSLDQLDPAERRCFATLGAMPGEFCLEAATQAGSQFSTSPCDMRLLLDRLVDKSLLEVSYGAGARRYRILGTVHALAREMLGRQHIAAPMARVRRCSCGCLAEAA